MPVVRDKTTDEILADRDQLLSAAKKAQRTLEVMLERHGPSLSGCLDALNDLDRAISRADIKSEDRNG